MRKIADIVKAQLKTVYKIIKKYKETGSIKDLPKSGRKRKTTIREDRWIIRQAKVKRTITSPQIQNGVRKLSGTVISSSLVRRV